MLPQRPLEKFGIWYDHESNSTVITFSGILRAMIG